jgi:hypothetical protein
MKEATKTTSKSANGIEERENGYGGDKMGRRVQHHRRSGRRHKALFKPPPPPPPLAPPTPPPPLAPPTPPPLLGLPQRLSVTLFRMMSLIRTDCCVSIVE